MQEEIGEAAGAVWTALATTPKATVAELRKKTGLSADQVNRAIGWLAREGKIVSEEKGKTVRFGLKG